MIKRLFSIQTFLVITIILYQFAFPIGNAMASTSTLPPSNLAFQLTTPDDGKLTWSAVFGATGYKVYEIKDGQIVLLGTTTAISYNLNDLPEGSYRYVVSTLTSEGESGPSAPVNADIVYPDMVEPADLTSTIRNGNDIVLSWGLSKYAQKYNIYQISESGERTLITTTTSTTYTKVNSAEGSYTYSVSAYHSLYGESADSTPVEVVVTKPEMKEPSNLSFTITNGTNVNLKWQAVQYATNYKVYELIDGQLNLKTSVPGTNVSFSNLPAGDYVYKVFSYSDRFGESTEGSQISLTVGSISMAPPSNVTYKVQNINDVVLNWGTVPYADTYKVYELINGEKVLKSSVKTPAVTYSMLKGGNYEYEIYSYSDRFGESENGSKVSFSIETVAINPPTELSYKIQNGNDIVLNWNTSENATNYKVYQIVNGQKTLKSTVTGTSVTYANMAAGEYQFEVHANSTRFGESEAGPLVSVSVEQINLSAPKNVKYEIKNVNDVLMTWDSVEFATSYKVYQIINGTKVLKSTVTNPTASLTNLQNGDTLYEIYSYNSRFGESKIGTNVTISLIHPEMKPPTNVMQSVINPTSFKISWSSVEYATAYKVYQIVNDQKVLKYNGSNLNVSYSNMAPGFYEYEVYSYSTRFGESKEGTSVEFTLNDQALPAPENFSFSIVNGNDLKLNWSAVPYATNYNMYEMIDGEYVFKRTVTGITTTFTNMPEGEFDFIIKTNSTLLGESPIKANVKGTIDFPVLAKPENVTHSISSGNDITLKWNAVTYATAYKIYQVIDGEKVFKKTVTSTSNVFTNMPEGKYLFEIHSYSDRFGESPEGSETSLEIIPPIMQAPGNFTKTIGNGNDIQLKWNTTPYAKEYRIYQIIDGEQILKRTVTGTATTFTNMPEGDYQYVVHSYSDRFGESTIGSTLMFNLAWPIVQAPSINGTVFNANNITLSWQAVTWANEYRVYKVNGDSKVLIYKGTALSSKVYNLTEETHSFEVTAYSTRFGESVPSNRFDTTIVYPIMEIPSASIKLLSENSARISWDFVTYANGYNVYELIDGKPVLLIENLNNLSYEVKNLSYANHEYFVTSFSNSFGESKPSETVLAKLIIDTEAPETQIKAPTQWVNQTQLITLEATDNEVGVANTFYSLNDGPFKEGTSVFVDQEGSNKISFYSTDKVGNIEQVKTDYVKIDKTAPTTEMNEKPEYAQSLTVELIGKDELSGIAKTFYSINGSEYKEGTSFVLEDEGLNLITYYSIDMAGNKEEVQSRKVNFDKTAPTTTSDAQETWGNKEVTVNLSASDENSGVAKTYYSFNGSNFVEGTTLVVEQEGINKISYYSVDKVGNSEKVNIIEVKIDKTSPVTDINKIPAYAQTFTVELTGKDELSGIAKTFYSINGSEYKEGTSFVVEKEGQNIISYYSIDLAGNKEEVQSSKVNIDQTAPTTSSDAPVSWYNKEVRVNLTANDENSGVAKTYYSINDSSFVEGTSFVIEQEGINRISYYSIDKAGNSEKVNLTEVKIDKTAPTVTIVLDKEFKLNDTFTLNYLADDNLSGIAFEQVTLNGQSYKNGDQITLDKPGEYKLLIKVTDAAGLSILVEKTFIVYIPVTLEVLPKVIKGNKGIFTVKVTLPEEYQSSLFDISTVQLNGVSPVTDNKGLQKQAEKGHFKFNREDFEWTTGEVNLEFRSYIDHQFLVVAKTKVEAKK
ncbi:MAG: OmpL47-type beta-barrel domain-containing protein [Paenisporosarcina sp.]